MTACTKEKIYKIQEISLKLFVLIPGTENLVNFLSFFFYPCILQLRALPLQQTWLYLPILMLTPVKKIIHVRLILLFFKITTKLMYFCIHLLWRYKHNGRFQDIIYMLSPTKASYLSEMKPDFAHIFWS